MTEMPALPTTGVDMSAQGLRAERAEADTGTAIRKDTNLRETEVEVGRLTLAHPQAQLLFWKDSH